MGLLAQERSVAGTVKNKVSLSRWRRTSVIDAPVGEAFFINDRNYFCGL